MWAVLEELQKEYHLQIEEFNIHNDLSIPEKYGAKRTPFIVLFDENKKEVWTKQGETSKKDILKAFKDNDINLIFKE